MCVHVQVYVCSSRRSWHKSICTVYVEAFVFRSIYSRSWGWFHALHLDLLEPPCLFVFLECRSARCEDHPLFFYHNFKSSLWVQYMSAIYKRHIAKWWFGQPQSYVSCCHSVSYTGCHFSKLSLGWSARHCGCSNGWYTQNTPCFARLVHPHCCITGILGTLILSFL